MKVTNVNLFALVSFFHRKNKLTGQVCYICFLTTDSRYYNLNQSINQSPLSNARLILLKTSSSWFYAYVQGQFIYLLCERKRMLLKIAFNLQLLLFTVTLGPIIATPRYYIMSKVKKKKIRRFEKLASFFHLTDQSRALVLLSVVLVTYLCLSMYLAFIRGLSDVFMLFYLSCFSSCIFRYLRYGAKFCLLHACDLQNSRIRRPWPALGCSTRRNTYSFH
jgi:hypothetical protein